MLVGFFFCLQLLFQQSKIVVPYSDLCCVNAFKEDGTLCQLPEAFFSAV